MTSEEGMACLHEAARYVCNTCCVLLRNNIMKPFRDNFVLVIKKYLCILYYSFPGIDSISNEQLLNGIMKYNSSDNYISILFELAICFFFQMIIVIFNEFIYLIVFNR